MDVAQIPSSALICEHKYNQTQILQLVKEKLPNTAIRAIQESEVPCFYKVAFQSTVESTTGFGYVSKNGEYLFLGVVLNLDKMQFMDGTVTGSSE